MWILNLGKPVNIPVLNEAMAIELGASLLGEAVIFFIASAILVAEYSRSSRKEAKKEQALLDEKDRQERTIQELYFVTQRQDTQIRELTRMIYDLDGRVVKVPWKGSKDPPTDIPPPGPPSLILPPLTEPLPPSTDDSNEMKPPHIVPAEGEVLKTPQSLTKKTKSKCPPPDGTINKAIAHLETEFWLIQSEAETHQQHSILYVALNHLYKDVYRLPMSY